MINTVDQEEDDLLELKPVLPPVKRWRSRIALLVLMISVFALAFCAGYFVAFSIHHGHYDSKGQKSDPAKYHKLIGNSIQADNIRENLRYLTSRQHIAGSSDSLEEVKHLKEFYVSAGFDNVEIVNYDVLLSYPVKPSLLSVKDVKNNRTVFQTMPMEKRLWKDENVKNVAYPFNAYSAAKSIQGKLIYVNYASQKDFAKLKELKISCKGHILIARYGHLFRGNKAELAEKAGALGLILFTDPNGYSRGSVKYPNSWWLPPDGVQRGTIKIGDGDPLSPGLPSIDAMYRLPVDNAALPKIPVQPISYHDALPLLRQMDGVIAPKEWQGGLNITYRITMNDVNNNIIQLTTNTKYKREKIHNVIATMTGAVEPDRMVLMGNHHDAWVMGACDPSSATSVLMEIGRTLGEARKQGWRPRRTIKLCAWDAEEYGLIGSTEWLEQNAKMLSDQAVAYLNSDIAVTGNFSIYGRMSAQLPDALFRAAKQVDDPDETGKTLYDTWRRKLPDPVHKDLPRVLLPGAGSDHKVFYGRLGVPVIDIAYVYDWNVVGRISSYPTYHSIHDSFHFMETFIDKDFKYHVALGRLWAQTGLELVDSVLLPFNYSKYAGTLQKCYIKFGKQAAILAQHNISMVPLKQTIERYTKAAREFNARIGKVNLDQPLKVRMINDKIMQVGRAVIAPEGLPGRPLTRHVIYAPSKYDMYMGTCFPGIGDSLYIVQKTGSKDWDQVKKQLSLVVYHLLQAISILESEF